MLSLFLIIACNKTDLQKSSGAITDDRPIITRGDCDDCPGEDECCCSLALDNGTSSASLFICGIVGGSTTCQSFVADCFSTSFVNGADNISLSSPGSTRYDFCMKENSIFYVRNFNTTTAANLTLTCQRGLTSPQIVQFQIPASGRKYYETDSGCELSECND